MRGIERQRDFVAAIVKFDADAMVEGIGAQKDLTYHSTRDEERGIGHEGLLENHLRKQVSLLVEKGLRQCLQTLMDELLNSRLTERGGRLVPKQEVDGVLWVLVQFLIRMMSGSCGLLSCAAYTACVTHRARYR